MAEVPGLEGLRKRNRSVEDISAYSDGTMNVWQALEVISGDSLRQKYNYEGYSDTDNVLRILTNSTQRRDSFADKVKSSAQPKKFSHTGRGSNGGGATTTKIDHLDANAVGKDIIDKGKRGSVFVPRRKSKADKIPFGQIEHDKEMLLLTLECTDLVKCSFNTPRISARLERLMGTNVVRLTDRKYMKELRERIDEDYRMQLTNRIKNREIKELERERNLILGGKTDTIPEELSADPIFVVNKRANVEIAKRRAKLKTNREKNADRMLRQALKWERERSRHEEQERRKQKQLEGIAQEKKALEEQFKEEDAQRGLDLLRITDSEWQDCEQSLRDFLESERNKMKKRSLLTPQPYTSDPQDIQNIIRARKKFRETEQRIRQQLENSLKPKSSARVFANKVSLLTSAIGVFASNINKEPEEIESHVSICLGDDDASGIPSSSSSLQKLPGPPDDIEQQKTLEIESQLEKDIQRGYLVSKDQYKNLHYDDLQIARLKEAANIRELYQIAEMIIIGEVESELMVEEEVTVEEEDSDES